MYMHVLERFQGRQTPSPLNETLLCHYDSQSFLTAMDQNVLTALFVIAVHTELLWPHSPRHSLVSNYVHVHCTWHLLLPS